MNAATTSPSPSTNALVPWHQMATDALWSVLENSVYPGAKRESILAVVETCRASGKDPLKKPYHIVPMSVKDAATDKYVWRDTIMPGINLYRIDAARTGEHCGTSEPEYGPMVAMNLGGVDVRFPEWCKIVVKRRQPDGSIAEFTAKEYWLENYATAGRDTQAPNTMWRKRPMGQIAKCAEAQALRKGFPEDCPLFTAEEMAGKSLDDGDVIDVEPKVIERPKPVEQVDAGEKAEGAEVSDAKDERPKQGSQMRQQAQRPQQNDQRPKRDEQGGRAPNEEASSGMLATIRSFAEKKNIAPETILKQFGMRSFDGMTKERGTEILNWVRSQ